MNTSDNSTSQWFDSGDSFLSHNFTDISVFYQSTKGHTILYRATRMGKQFILKTLRPELQEDMFFRSALLKEFDLGYRLQHPYIVQTLGMEEVPGIGLCIILEWIEGMSLRKWLQKNSPSSPEQHRLIQELCEALNYLHTQGIIHRDLKPENIMITTNGAFVKLIDFGCSDADSYQILKNPAGTRRYAAPELFQPEAVIDSRADIYALGIIIQEMNRPWWKASWRLFRVGRKCCRKERNKRYTSAQAVHQALTSSSKQKGLFLTIFLILSGTIFWWSEKRNSISQDIPSVAPVRDTLYVTQRETLIQLQTDTVFMNEKNPVAPINYIDRKKEEKALQQLLAFTQTYTLQEMEKARQICQDTSISVQERIAYSNNVYFIIEKRIKQEVAKIASSTSLEYATYLNLVLTQMTQTIKEYNAKNPIVIQ